MYIMLIYIIATRSNLQGEPMAKLELPELEQNNEVNATRFVQDAGKRPKENKTKLASFRIPNELLEFIDNESKRLHRPKTKIIKAALLAYQDLDENELVNLWFRADRND